MYPSQLRPDRPVATVAIAPRPSSAAPLVTGSAVAGDDLRQQHDGDRAGAGGQAEDHERAPVVADAEERGDDHDAGRAERDAVVRRQLGEVHVSFPLWLSFRSSRPATAAVEPNLRPPGIKSP